MALSATRYFLPHLAFVATLLAGPADAQAPAASTLGGKELIEQAVALRGRALSQSQAYKILESLTQQVGPRLAGSPGDEAAVAWALLKMQELGLSAVRTQDVEVPRWERGQIGVKITAPFPQMLVATALGGSVGTNEQGIEAPVLAVENVSELDTMPAARVNGTVVYFSERTHRSRDGKGYGRSVLNRRDGPAVAASLGARAVIIRSIGTSQDRMAHTGMTKYRDGVIPIPAVAISNPDADILEYQLASEQPVTVHITLSARNLPPTRSANVIGEIPGSELPEQIVLLGAHLDSWDLGTGAVDDGAGVAMVMEVARLIKSSGLRPRRTIRVVLFANEEFGLTGAKAYAAEANVDRHVLGLEADLGAGRVWRLDSGVPDEALERVQLMHSLIAELGVELGSNDSEGGADISAMRQLGMPVLSPSQDASAYFDVHHTANDTLDKVSKADLDQNVAVYATLAFLAAGMDGDLGHFPMEVAPSP